MSQEIKKYVTNFHVINNESKKTVFSYLARFLGFIRLIYIIWNFNSDQVLINSSKNLRVMLACIILNKSSIVYLREFSSMLSKNKLILFLRIKVLLLSNHIISVSYSNSKWIQNHGYSGRKISVIHNGITRKYIDELASKELDQFDAAILKNKYVVSIIGYMSERKGIDYFLEITKKLASINDKYFFLIIGDFLDQNTKNEYLQFIHKYSLKDRFLVTGYTDNIFKYLRYTDIVCLTSRSESLPRVVLESMAMKVPIVAFNVGGTAELLPVFYNYLVEPFDLNSFTVKVIELSNLPSNNAIKDLLYSRSLEFTNRHVCSKVIDVIDRFENQI